MKKIRLLVVEPSEEQLQEAVAQNGDREAVRTQLTLRYKALIQTALRTPLDARSGVSIEEMEKSLGILKKVSAVEDGGILEMDDVDFDYLMQKIGAVRWMGFDERIVTFVHTVRNATKDVLDEESSG